LLYTCSPLAAAIKLGILPLNHCSDWIEALWNGAICRGITGWGDSWPTAIETYLLQPGDYKQYAQNTAKRWPNYHMLALDDNRALIIRSRMATVAIQLYLKILKLGQTSDLQIVGMCHGGNIALLLTDVIRLAAIKKQCGNNFSKLDSAVQALDPDVVAQEQDIKPGDAIKSIALVTIATPVSTESNAIVQRNVSEKNPLVSKHLHLFSDYDWIAALEPGLASKFWSFSKREFATPAMNTERLQQINLKCFTVQTDGKEQKLIPTHKNFIEHFQVDNLEFYHDTKSLLWDENELALQSGNGQVQFTNNFFRRKDFISSLITLSAGAFFLRKIFNLSVKKFWKKEKASIQGPPLKAITTPEPEKKSIKSSSAEVKQ
jgi:hypothetical protein